MHSVDDAECAAGQWTPVLSDVCMSTGHCNFVNNNLQNCHLRYMYLVTTTTGSNGNGLFEVNILPFNLCNFSSFLHLHLAKYGTFIDLTIFE